MALSDTRQATGIAVFSKRPHATSHMASKAAQRPEIPHDFSQQVETGMAGKKNSLPDVSGREFRKGFLFAAHPADRLPVDIFAEGLLE